jgi:hypothetical protein
MAFAAFVIVLLFLSLICSILAWYNNNVWYGSMPRNGYYDYNYNNYDNRYNNRDYLRYENFDNTPTTVGTLAQLSNQEQAFVKPDMATGVPNAMSNNIPATVAVADNQVFAQETQVPAILQPALQLQTKPFQAKAYPLFSNSLPAENISPVEDMTHVADKYLSIDKKYRFDGNKLVDFPADFYLLDDGASGNYGGVNNICSKSCCAPQWPVPFKTAANDSVCGNPNLVGTNYSCNSTFQDSGCMCMTKEQVLNISTRGGNAGTDALVY